MTGFPPDVADIAAKAYSRWIKPNGPIVLVDELIASAIMEDRRSRATRLALTPKQMEALAFIREYVASHGYSPSYDEIATGIQIASKSGVNRLVVALEERGYIKRLRYRARTIALIEAAA